MNGDESGNEAQLLRSSQKHYDNNVCKWLSRFKEKKVFPASGAENEGKVTNIAVPLMTTWGWLLKRVNP